MPIEETSSATDERAGMVASESNPLNIRNERTAAIMNEITWLEVSDEAKRPMAE